MQTLFGSGVMWAVPMINLAGNNVATPTPIPFGAMQEATVDFSFGKKELYGLSVFPIDVARATGKIDIKAKMARFQALLFNQLFGETPNANELKVAYQEALSVSANNATVAAGANFSLDLGVWYANNMMPLTRAANVSAGNYVVGANGNYSFNESNNTAILISYAFTGANSNGSNFTINNQLLGLSPFFKVVLNQNRRARHMTLVLNRCVATKIGIGTKLEDFNIPDFEASAMADDAGVVGTWSFNEAY